MHHFTRIATITLIAVLLSFSFPLQAQIKILFDATKAESAANADWVIDSDLFNLSWSSGPPVPGGGNEANPQQTPTPAQSGITSSTPENYWKGGISSWGIESVQQGYQVYTLPYNGQITYGNSSNAQDLSNYKVFVVCEPNILFTAAEKTALMQFVQNGGGLCMVADHTGSDRNNDGVDSPDVWNDFMTNNGVQANPFGITFDYASFSQTTSNIPNLPADPLLHGIMGDVTQAQWSSGTSITMSPASNSSVEGVVYKTGSTFGNTGVMVAYATYGNGKVVAIGDSSPADDGTGDNNDQLYDGWIGDAAGNHRILIMNATIWLATSSVPLPTVTTSAASSITSSTATLNGTVNPNGSSTSYYFQWGTTTSYGNQTSTVSAGSGSSAVNAFAGITGLTAGNTYHFRLVATNAAGTSNGIDQQFTTPPVLPTLTTTAASLITNSSAETGGNISSAGGGTISARGVCWATTANPDITGNLSFNGTGAGTFTSSLSGLTANTLYHIRAYATNEAGTAYGNDLNFTTAANMLSITPASQNVTSAAGSTSFTVTSNTSWTASSDQSWCTVPASGTGNGTLTASYTQNSTYIPRTANITVTASGIAPVVVSVVQAGALPPDFQFTIANDIQTSEKTLEFDLLLLDTDPSQPFELATIQAGIYANAGIYNGGTVTASIIAGSSALNTSQQPSSVTFTQSANCIKLAAKAPPGSGGGTILSTNPSNPTRVCRIKLTNTVNWSQATPNLTFCFTLTPYPTKISQYVNGINTALTTNSSNCYSVCANGLLNPPPVLSVSPLQQTVGQEAGSTQFEISTNAGWTALSDSPSWCSLGTSSGFGSNTLTASFTANPSSSPRTAQITITVGGLTPVVVTVVQEGLLQTRNLNLQLFIEGLYAGGGFMNQAMDESGIHWGTGIADKISIELHDASNYSNVLYTLSNLDLHTDGTVLTTIPASYSGSYYLTLRHRNSLETVSSIPVSFAATQISYSFNVASNAFGDNLLQDGDGTWVIYGGDVNQDGIIDSGDMIPVDNDAAGFVAGYIDTDVNGDGLVDSGDMIIIDNHAAAFVSKATP